MDLQHDAWMPVRRQVAHWLLFVGFFGGVYNILDGLMRKFYLAPTPKTLALAESGTGYLVAGLVGVVLSAVAVAVLRKGWRTVQPPDAPTSVYVLGAVAVAIAVVVQL